MSNQDQPGDEQTFAGIHRLRLDRYVIDLPAEIRQLLVMLSDQMESVLDSDADQLTRLFPTAYPHDPEMDAGFQIFARGQLADQRTEALSVLRATAHNEEVNEEELNAWMRVINDLRLVLGTRLDVGEEDVLIDDEDPDAELHHIYHLLGMLLSEIVDAFEQDLPQDPELDFTL